ncbi:MAG: nucleotidyltransferase family protein [Nanoarchaeota archaeon]|nr:nucleotidyltransferase family protein [Nanoarchaeota archaeon]
MAKKELTIKQIARIAVPILKRNDVVKAGIFGSYARREMKKTSDVDFLIKIKGKKSLLDVVGIQLDLQRVLGKKVDLVEYKEIHPPLKKQILNEEIRIL